MSHAIISDLGFTANIDDITELQRPPWPVPLHPLIAGTPAPQPPLAQALPLTHGEPE